MKRIEISANYPGVAIQGAGITVTTGSMLVNGTFRLGTNSKLQLTDTGTPLTGVGWLDTTTNTPNTVEYKGCGDIALTDGDVQSTINNLKSKIYFNNLSLTPPSGIGRADVFTGSPPERYYDMAALDQTTGFLYIGTKNKPARIVKIRLS
ncbi:MAG: hypothetical protein V1899_07475, partial [Planctomycetota bacterium]